MPEGGIPHQANVIEGLEEIRTPEDQNETSCEECRNTSEQVRDTIRDLLSQALLERKTLIEENERLRAIRECLREQLKLQEEVQK